MCRLGAKVVKKDSGDYEVEGVAEFKSPSDVVDMGNAETGSDFGGGD